MIIADKKLDKLIEHEYITKDWAYFIPSAFRDYYDKIAPKIMERSKETTIYPKDSKDTFRAFKECPVDKLKVVIIGQD